AEIEGRIYRLRLDENIFRNLRQSYERDLAIFNASGDAIPFTFLHDASWNVPQNTYETASASVPLFLLPKRATKTAPGNDITIRTGADGSVIEVKGMKNFTPAEGTGVYLIDLTKTPREGAVGYKLELPLSGESETAASVNVFGSVSLRDWENRSSWRKLAANEPLVFLKQGEASVNSGVIEIGNAIASTNYLILEIDGIGGIMPKSAVLRVIKKRETTASPPDSAAFEGALDTESSAVYDTEGVFPATGVNFILKSPGIYEATVSSRGDPDDYWLWHADARISLIALQNGESRSVPIGISGRGKRFWRLSLQGARLAEPPTLELFWRPIDVVFMAQGKSPYIIALGSDNKLAPSLQRSALMKGALEAVGTRRVLVSSLTPDAPTEIQRAPDNAEDEAVQTNWARYMVWSALIAGAALLSWMAFSLLKKG
ncbi:MAG: DUF3999 domain-containing protein, partial [Synergistaceae bacterium]|nr:DUF3999 domain-containing protein [Synergistaceae bacterium]